VPNSIFSSDRETKGFATAEGVHRQEEVLVDLSHGKCGRGIKESTLIWTQKIITSTPFLPDQPISTTRQYPPLSLHLVVMNDISQHEVASADILSSADVYCRLRRMSDKSEVG
jgi:hypothetical protein